MSAQPAIDDSTRLTITMTGATFRTTLGLLLADNEDALDRGAVVAALEAGEVYMAGGGAAPHVLISREA